MCKFTQVKIEEAGRFTYQDGDMNCKASANFPLVIIRMAWDAGCNLEPLADGFGAGNGTMGDWSGIRDSSPEATAKMLRRSLNFIHGKLSYPAPVLVSPPAAPPQS